MEFSRAAYHVTSKGLFSRDRGLRDQVRRAAVSIPSNIAEGFERGGTAEFIQFLSIAKGSNGEVLTHLFLARDLGYLSSEDFSLLERMCLDAGKSLGGFMNYLRKAGVKGAKYR